ncbi:hypothetical protein CGRA01v4_00535 [Colletotrichum graminicola]|nr:hypothetical protein CGRA01v4_00535 [Colletotrichum graminicola]
MSWPVRVAWPGGAPTVASPVGIAVHCCSSLLFQRAAPLHSTLSVHHTTYYYVAAALCGEPR